MTDRLAAPAIRRAVEVLAHTWRLEIAGEEHVATLREQGTSVLFAVWHALLLPPLWHRKREHITLLVSQHADAEGLKPSATNTKPTEVGSSAIGHAKGFL